MAEVNLTDLVRSSRPSRRLSHMGMFVLAALALLVWTLIISREQGGLIQMLLSWAILAGLGITIVSGAIRRQALAKWFRSSSDLCLMEKWSAAAEPLRQLLRKPVPVAQVRYQALLELAGVAEHTGELGEAEEIYQAIAEEQPGGLLGSLALLGRAIVLLKLDRLADAEAVIRPLEIASQSEPLKALVGLARLYQQIRTGHYAEALENESDKCESARQGLGTKAAFIYALLALAHKHMAKVGGADESDSKQFEEQSGRARELWQKATMLIRPDNLIQKFPELAEMAETFPPAPELPEASAVAGGSADVRANESLC